MDIISKITAKKYATTNAIFATMSSAVHFSDTIKLQGRTRQSLCGKFKQLERLICTTNFHWWDKFFLQLYIDLKVSPRGLRVMKDCPLYLNEELNKEWTSIAEFCTTKWMGTLISHRTDKFNSANQQINSLIEEISRSSTEIPSSWLEILKEKTQKDEDNFINKKMGKLKRDLDDYNLNRIFSWNKKNRPYTPPTHTNSHSLNHTRQDPVSLSHPPIPLMSIRFSNDRISNIQQRKSRHPQFSNPLPRHPHNGDNNKKDELIRALHQFYNRPQNPKTPTSSISSGPSVSVAPMEVPNKSSGSSLTPNPVNSSIPTKPESSLIKTLSTPNNPISCGPPSAPSSSTIPPPFLAPSPPLAQTSRKRKLIEEDAEGDRRENQTNTLKYPKL